MWSSTTLAMCHVLILVLVEHTLGDMDNHNFDNMLDVLILVLVEHTLGGLDRPLVYRLSRS